MADAKTPSYAHHRQIIIVAIQGPNQRGRAGKGSRAYGGSQLEKIARNLPATRVDLAAAGMLNPLGSGSLTWLEQCAIHPKPQKDDVFAFKISGSGFSSYSCACGTGTPKPGPLLSRKDYSVHWPGAIRHPSSRNCQSRVHEDRRALTMCCTR